MKAEDIPILKPSEITERLIFKIIWTTRSHKSFLSDMWLREYEGSLLYFNMFAHVLPKGQNKYPYFKFYLKNIVLLTPGEHALYDQGTEEARINYSLDIEEQSGGKNKAEWGKLEALAEELRKEYDLYFPTTRGLMIGVKYNLQEQQVIIGDLNKKYLEGL